MKATSSVLGKSRKGAIKDREKRKSQVVGETSGNRQSAEKSPTKESGTKKYAGISSESVACMAEQVLAERLSEDVSKGLAEDISYKLRAVIQNACLNMKMGKRENLTVHDVDSALQRLQVEKIYGPEKPEWVPFGNENLSYVEDTIVQLQDLATRTASFQQPSYPIIERQWLMAKPIVGVPEIPKTLVNYFIKCSQAIISPDPQLKDTALDNIKSNYEIGPILIWFYNYVYLLLKKYPNYELLINRSLELLEALELNPTSRLVNYNQQLERITMQLFKQMFLSVNNPKMNLEEMSRIMFVLCSHWLEGREKVLEKILAELPKTNPMFYVVVVHVLNALGQTALNIGLRPILSLFIQYMDCENNQNADLRFAFFKSCSLYYQTNNVFVIDMKLYDIFGEIVVPLRRIKCYSSADDDLIPESNWINVKLKLFKTQRKINNVHRTTMRKFNREDVFQCYCNTLSSSNKIKIKFNNFIPRCQLCKRNINTLTNGVSVSNCVNSKITVGKTSFLLKIDTFENASRSKKYNKYNLRYYNL